MHRRIAVLIVCFVVVTAFLAFGQSRFKAGSKSHHSSRSSGSGWTARSGPTDEASFHLVVVPPGFENVAILGTNSVRVGTDATVGTDLKPANVVGNDASTGPVLDEGVELAVDRNATIWGDASADSIDRDRGASINGVVYCNDGGGVSCSGVTLPVFSELPPFQVSNPRPDAEDVLVGPGEEVTLTAGDYGEILVDRTGTLIFAGGVYNIAQLGEVSTVGGQCQLPCRSYLFEAASDVRVLRKLKIGAASKVGPTAGSGISASSIIFYVGGINGQDGLLASSPAAAEISQASEVAANFYVPNGTLIISKESAVSGAFLARDVRLDKNTTVELDSAFRNEAPSADPQDVFTNGDELLEIILTGSDPEGGNLSFSLVSFPSEGSLTQPVPIIPEDVGRCSISAAACTLSSPCGVGEGVCQDFALQAITGATVAYGPSTDENRLDSFIFQVEDPEGAFGTAMVTINPPGDPTEPPDPVDTVIANPGSVHTLKETSVIVLLTGEAPCDGVCDVGDEDLVFSIVGGAGPGDGSLSAVTQGIGVPNRNATVTYTPNVGFTGGDSFDFEACAGAQCDTATVQITVNRLANDQTVTTGFETEVAIVLSGSDSGGGAGEASKRAPGPGGKFRKAIALVQVDVAGRVADTDTDGLGDYKDNLPGPYPVYGNAGVDVTLGGVGSISDPSGDSTGSDLVSAVITVGGGNLVAEVRFEAGSYDVAVTRAQIFLDLDQNPATGQGVDSDCSDNDIIGAEYFVEAGGSLAGTAPVRNDLGICNSWGSAGAGTTAYVTDGFDVTVPLSVLGGDDGVLNFKLNTFEELSGGGFTGVLDYMTDLTVSPGTVSPTMTGTTRFQLEFDITNAGWATSVTLSLPTKKGPDDTLDTLFYVGSTDAQGGQPATLNKQLDEADFEALAEELSGVVMPIPDVAVGTEGTFSMSLTDAVKVALDAGLTVMSIQGRVDEAHQGFGQGLSIQTTATGTQGPEVTLSSPPPVAPSLTYRVMTLPTTGGKLFVGQTEITAVPYDLGFDPEVRFVPNTGYTGSAAFEFEVKDLNLVSDIGVITILVVQGSCVTNAELCSYGRP